MATLPRKMALPINLLFVFFYLILENVESFKPLKGRFKGKKSWPPF